MSPRFPEHSPDNHTHLSGYTRTVSLHRVFSRSADYLFSPVAQAKIIGGYYRAAT
jgi:hypothetical protein